MGKFDGSAWESSGLCLWLVQLNLGNNRIVMRQILELPSPKVCVRMLPIDIGDVII